MIEVLTAYGIEQNNNYYLINYVLAIGYSQSNCFVYRNFYCKGSITQSAGIGGGTLINLLLIGGFDYTTKESIIMSYIFLMGGGLAATLASAKKVTANGKRLLDFDLVLLTLPMMISGSIVGVHFLKHRQ